MTVDLDATTLETVVEVLRVRWLDAVTDRTGTLADATAAHHTYNEVRNALHDAVGRNEA
jgi:hypothetical protein